MGYILKWLTKMRLFCLVCISWILMSMLAFILKLNVFILYPDQSFPSYIKTGQGNPVWEIGSQKSTQVLGLAPVPMLGVPQIDQSI